MLWYSIYNKWISFANLYFILTVKVCLVLLSFLLTHACIPPKKSMMLSIKATGFISNYQIRLRKMSSGIIALPCNTVFL